MNQSGGEKKSCWHKTFSRSSFTKLNWKGQKEKGNFPIDSGRDWSRLFREINKEKKSDL